MLGTGRYEGAVEHEVEIKIDSGLDNGLDEDGDVRLRRERRAALQVCRPIS